MKPLYLVDASNWCYKFKAVFHNRCSIVRNDVSIDTSILYGFYRSLKALPFNDIFIILDGIPEYSLSLLSTYKGTRNHEKDEGMAVSKVELYQFLSTVGTLLNKNIQVVCSPCQETDQVVSSIVHYISHRLPSKWRLMSSLNSKPITSDRILSSISKTALIGSVSTEYLDQFDSVIIASTDADFVQLQRFGNVYIDTSTTGKEISNTRSTDSTSRSNPFSAVLYKAIFGDVSDNIPPIASFNKNEVLKTLASVDSESMLSQFVSIITSGPMTETDLPSELILLAEEIHHTCKSAFLRNYHITFLTFVSIPYSLQYPDGDYEAIANKYCLRLYK